MYVIRQQLGAVTISSWRLCLPNVYNLTGGDLSLPTVDELAVALHAVAAAVGREILQQTRAGY